MLFQSKEIMTDEQRDIIIAKMIDAHSTLTDEELDLIANDIELSDIQELSAAVRGAYVPKPEINVDDEWSRFRKRMTSKPSPLRRLIIVAAILMGVALIYSIMAIIFDHKLTPDQQELIAEINHPQESAIVQIAEDQILDTTVLTEEPQLSYCSINQTKPDHSYKRHHSANEISDSTTIDQTEEIDIDEYLRIQQAMIDNDIAMLNAEILLDKYAAIQQMYDLIGEDEALIEATIQKITMQ